MLHRCHSTHGARRAETRVTARVSTSVPAVVALLLIVQTACSAAPSTSAPPAGTPLTQAVRTPVRPTIGGCHQTDWKVFQAKTASTAEVDCSVPHTTQTVYVGTYPSSTAAKSTRYDDLPIVTWVVPRCFVQVASYLGTDPETLSRTLFSPTIFFAPQSAFASGAHWFRCDVGLVENAKQTLLPLPQHVEQALAKTIPETYVGCIQQSDFAHPPISPPTVSCTEPHNGRPIGGVRLGRPHDPYPPVAMVRSRAAHGCVARARQWSRTHGTSDGVAFRAPDKQFWDLDIYRSAACYILTSN